MVVACSNEYATSNNNDSSHSLASISIPTGIPIGAESVCFVKPAGKTQDGNPVTAPSTPFLST